MPFSYQHQITIEKTPKYFIDSQVPKRVYKMNPKMKLIIVLRNPVTRAISDYTQSLEKSSANTNSSIKKFENMLFDSNSEIRANWPIVRNGLYFIHLKNWLKYFPLNQIHFVNGEELIKNPFNEIKKVEEFLNLKPVIQEKHFIYNLRKGFPCIMKPLDSGIIRCLNEKKGRKHPFVPDNVLNKLNEFYKPYSEALFKKIKQKPFWPIV
jgi:Leucine-rich repeat (LRR) protein